MNRKLTWSGLEGYKVLLAPVAADVRIAVVRVTVPFSAVLHAQLVSVADATANIINRYNMRHRHFTALA